MADPKLRVARVSFRQVPLAGLGIAMGSEGKGHTTVIAPGEHADQPTMNPVAIEFENCMVVHDYRAVGRANMQMLAIPFADPMNPGNDVHVNMQWGEPSNMVIAAITIDDLERVVDSLRASLDLAKLEQKARAAG